MVVYRYRHEECFYFGIIFEVKEMVKKVVKEEEVVKTKKKKEKKEKKPGYFKEVRGELKKVTFPSFKNVMKYTFATIVFCGLLVGFFILLNLLLSGIKGMF